MPKQPKSVKPWESNISDDSEDEEGAPRSAVTLISAADKRNLVSKRGQSDPKLLEASLYNEKVVPNLNRRFIEPDDLKKRKKDRKERDMAQAWGASLGKPRSKPVGMPEHETTAPWDLNASGAWHQVDLRVGCEEGGHAGSGAAAAEAGRPQGVQQEAARAGQGARVGDRARHETCACQGAAAVGSDGERRLGGRGGRAAAAGLAGLVGGQAQLQEPEGPERPAADGVQLPRRQSKRA